ARNDCAAGPMLRGRLRAGPVGDRFHPPERLMTAFTTVIESLLARGCSVRFRASGGSMHPTIRAGDILILAPIDPTELRKGTVVLARQSGRLVAHRIADVTKCDGGTRVLLRGDALS